MKGIYVLIILVGNNIIVNVGALGDLVFRKASYAYIGSAQKGVKKRIERHLRKTKRKFWHIDYLLCNDAARVTKVFYKKAEKLEGMQSRQKNERDGVSNHEVRLL